MQTFITGLGVPQKRKWPKLDRQALKNVDSSRAEFSEIQYCWVLVTFTAQEKSETRIANDIVYNSGRWCNPLNKLFIVDPPKEIILTFPMDAMRPRFEP